MKLVAAKLKALPHGRYGDGNGLYLVVSKRESRSWVFRYRSNGNDREMGLGGWPIVTLAEARQAALSAQILRRQGVDPLDQRTANKLAAREPQRTFAVVAEIYFEDQRAGWRSEQHADQWKVSLQRHVYPIIGDKPVAQITLKDVLGVLRPIWSVMPVTASRVRGRIEVVLSAAKTLGWRDGENPAIWRDNLKTILAPPKKIRTVRHHPALSWEEMPDFMRELRRFENTPALALEFCILTVVRTGAVLQAQWREVNLVGGVWTIPPKHEKAGVEHRVPLSRRALEILDVRRELSGCDPDSHVFQGAIKRGKLSKMAMLNFLQRRMGRESVTVQGFRSTFRDWVGETRDYAADVAEAALSHKFGQTRASYQRGTMFMKRQAMMEDWCEYCTSLKGSW